VTRRRAAVFVTALAIRCSLAFVTFGSVEAISNFRETVRVLSGQHITAPYLPGLELWLWAGSVITHYTTLPATFPHKFLPILFDSLIALLLYDSARRGVRYALCVLPIVISAMQPQWDSVFLYFLLLALVLLREERERSDALAAVAWTLSIIAKPLAIPLFILLLPRTWRRARAFVAGIAITGAVYVGILAALHALPTLADFAGIASYASRGVLLFGLPHRPWNRMAMVLLTLAVVMAMHLWKQLDRETGVLVYFAGAIGFSGLCPQYLMWILPFALLTRRDRFFAAYSLVASVFVVFFYQCPIVNLPNGENLGAFAMLRPLGAFSPPLPSVAVLPFVRFLGNLAIPLLALGLVAYELARAVTRSDARARPPVDTRALLAPPLLALAVLGAAVAWAAVQPPLRVEPFIARVQEKIGAYDVVRWNGPTMMAPGSKIWVARTFVDERGAHAIANLATLLLGWSVIVAIASLNKNPLPRPEEAGASRTSAATGSRPNAHRPRRTPM
jgi:hypothetical protein